MKDWKDKENQFKTTIRKRERVYADLIKNLGNDEKSEKAKAAFRHVPQY